MMSGYVTTTAEVVLFTFYLTISYITGQDLTYQIQEEKPPSFFIGNIVNESRFLEENNTEKIDRENIRFNILSQGNPYAHFFSINDRTGDLYTNGSLDRESISSCEFSENCELRIDVSAQSTIGTFFRIIKVRILLLDINDNRPYFLVNNTKLDVSEAFVPQSSLPLEGAIDLDSGQNSIQNYSIRPDNSPFSLAFDRFVDGSSSLKLVLNRKLDRELEGSYRIVIEAIDGGSPTLTGSLFVNITVTDVNDNRPTFSQSTYNISIDENTPVSNVILNMRATDRDIGKNGLVSYRLSPYQSDEIKQIFTINETHGNLSLVKPLTYRSGEVLKVIIEASDNADQPLISQATVFAKVLDSTNSPPKINVNLLSNTQSAKIAESASVGAAVAHIGVTDDDDGQNGIVNCSVDNPSFRLERLEVNEYKVVVAVGLDREKISEYDVVVKCQDTGIPVLSSSSSFKVTVIDVNDQPPRFTKTTYYAEMYENNEIGHTITKVLALDYDTGINAKISYSLSQTGNYRLAIDPTHGYIFANFKTDRENVSMINFQVIATDHGVHPKTGTAYVSVTILDRNDNKPRFSNNLFTLTAQENQPAGMVIGHISATDADLGNNGTFDFFMSKDNDPKLPFLIHKNGSIFTKEPLDREENPHGINFKVVAIDKGTPVSLSSTGYVTIFISDENDNYPQILFPNTENRTIAFLFDLPINSIIGKVKAMDKDYDQNSKLSFSFEQPLDFLSLDQDSGEIKLSRPLTFADVNKYHLTVIVEDRGHKKLSVNKTLTVVVISHPYSASTPSFLETTDDNVMIVVVIICVTVVLAGSIILTIFLIRRFDHKRNDSVNNNTVDTVTKNQNAANDEKDMYDAVDKTSKREKGEKRVSFSDTSQEVSFDTLEMERHHYKANPAKEDVERILDTIMPPPKPRISQVKSIAAPPQYNHQPNSQLEKLRLHQNILSMHSSQSKIHRDDDSETSMESNTSDSGRGGSESDIHSSGGLSQCQELDYLKQLYPHSDSQEHLRLKHSKDNLIQLRDIQPKLKHSKQADANSHRKHADRRVNEYGHSSDLTDVPFSAYKPKLHYINSMSDIMDGSFITNEDEDDLSTTTSGSYTVDDIEDFSLHAGCIV